MRPASLDSVVVLLSGGVDSTTLAAQAHAAHRLHSCIFFDFGQPAVEHERRSAVKWGEAHGVEVAELWQPLHGSMADGVGVAGARVLPGRNLALLARAINYAAAHRVPEVWFGAIYDDYADYRDCRPEFERGLSALAEQTYGVRVRAPYTGLRKRDVLGVAGRLGVDLTATWSCYQPTADGQPCGACNSCDGLRHAVDASTCIQCEGRIGAYELTLPGIGTVCSTRCADAEHASRKASGGGR